LCIVRAHRAATVALVGPEGNSLVAWAVRHIVEERLTDTVIVDGAINRITQAASVDGAQFVYTLRVDGSSLGKSLAQVRRIAALASLPVVSTPDERAGDLTPPLFLEGALTAETAARLPVEAGVIVVDDFTKVFLGDQELSAFRRSRGLFVRHRIEFGGFVVMCRGITDGEFKARLADDAIAALVAYNPYEPETGRAA